ncbi:KAT8 regulatory NSL complex subunit [Parasponia andersonii]|uniref:KAT8 regulatory NSL complex subunit n=1 Tax=Parasponia andersonii TaxID=3476 RepID=A0A2P5C305_PARAD|nr:KAT8 regulatory NSL complex subunit [Parasponia andersonii]
MAECPPESPSSPSPSSPMTIDGSDRDSALASSEWLSRREVLERRSRRVKQLARLYRHHYWALMEDLKAKHREYYWTYGKSPFKEDEAAPPANGTDGYGENGRLGFGSGGGNGDDIGRCQVANCKAKAMALTEFCHAHILSDPHQKLYKGCTYVIKSMQSGPLLCCKPVLRTTVPSLCPTHFQKNEKCLIRDLRKAGLNVSSLSNLAPKLHVIVAEYVCQIQTRRRAIRKASVAKVEPK